MTEKTLPISMILITKNMINQRIDNFMHKTFKNVPKSMIYRIIRTGKIRVNTKKISPFYKLQFGDTVKIPKIKILTNKNKTIMNLNKIKNLSHHILYEDNDILIINKPSGIAVHGGSGLNFGIIEYFRKLRPLNSFLELAHRIDRETSGILILAKKRLSLISLHQQFRENKIKKEYLGLVHGLWPKNIKQIAEPLLKLNNSNTKKKVVINHIGQSSETFFKIKKKFSNATLLAITPKTGRTHQIRVHTSHIGHPIFFDQRYGNHQLDVEVKNIVKIHRLMLHSSSIKFIHPINNKIFYIQAPLDSNTKKYLDHMI